MSESPEPSALPSRHDDVLDQMLADVLAHGASLSEADRIAVAAQVFRAVCDNAREGGTFRYLIYDRLGFSPAAYVPLYLAGGQTVSNNFTLAELDWDEEPRALTELRARAQAAPMAPHPTLKRSDGTPIPWPTKERSSLFAALHLLESTLDTNRALHEANRRLAARCEALEKASESATGDPAPACAPTGKSS